MADERDDAEQVRTAPAEDVCLTLFFLCSYTHEDRPFDDPDEFLLQWRFGPQYVELATAPAWFRAKARDTPRSWRTSGGFGTNRDGVA